LLALGAGPACSDGQDVVVGPELSAQDFSFQPTEFLVKAGRQVTITVVNRGAVAHNLSIPSIPVDLDFGANRRETVIFVLPDEGVVEFFCKFHADRGMKGSFRVRA